MQAEPAFDSTLKYTKQKISISGYDKMLPFNNKIL